MKLNLYIVSLIGCLLLLPSCKKEPAQQPVVSKPQLSVALNAQYMPGSKVDSAFALWEINGQAQTLKMELHDDTLSADSKLFMEGDGKLIIQVFSHVKFENQYLSQWIQEKQVTIQHDKTIRFAGPASFTDSQWSPRVMLKDAIGHFAVVALRPDDPYFFIKDVKSTVRKIQVARNYWNTIGGVAQVGGGEWQCISCANANGDIENKQFFSFLPSQIGTRTWNHIEVVILYQEDEWGGGSVLSLNHSIQ
jgi:hypothetical protein